MITLEEYREELELMEKQYGQEEELYPYIYMLLREAGYTIKYSVRSIAGARRAKSVNGRELLMGYGAFPDIAILDKNFLRNENGQYQPGEEIKKLYCCVEAKKIKDKLLDIKGKIEIEADKNVLIEESGLKIDLCKKNGKATSYGELIGELLWYGRVIYTNGKIWKYLKIRHFNKGLDQYRIDLYDTCVKNSKDHEWCQNFKNKKFEVIEKLLINIAPETTESDWEDFKTKLRLISKGWDIQSKTKTKK